MDKYTQMVLDKDLNPIYGYVHGIIQFNLGEETTMYVLITKDGKKFKINDIADVIQNTGIFINDRLLFNGDVLLSTITEELYEVVVDDEGLVEFTCNSGYSLEPHDFIRFNDLTQLEYKGNVYTGFLYPEEEDELNEVNNEINDMSILQRT